MSQSRSEEPVPQSRPTLSAFMSTFATQPIRVMLSRSQKDFWPWETLLKGWSKIGSGLPINLVRGTASTALAAHAKKHTGDLVEGNHPLLSTAVMLFASSVTGMSVAYGCETWFMRRSNLPKSNILHGVKMSPFNFSLALIPLYFTREVGFGGIVFYSHALPPAQENAVLVAGTVFTATAQKFISAVATGDLMAREGTVPDFKSGFVKTIRDVARGDFYTHPSYRGYYANPASLTKQMANFIYVGCNPSIFFWRLSYLYGFKYAYRAAEKNGSAMLTKLSMFARSLDASKSYLLTESERDIMDESDQHNPFYKHL
jgi:hypothetical protein